MGQGLGSMRLWKAAAAVFPAEGAAGMDAAIARVKPACQLVGSRSRPPDVQ